MEKQCEDGQEHGEMADKPGAGYYSSRCCQILAKLGDLLELERSEAADREKRLTSRIENLNRTVVELVDVVATLQSGLEESAIAVKDASPSSSSSSSSTKGRASKKQPPKPMSTVHTAPRSTYTSYVPGGTGASVTAQPHVASTQVNVVVDRESDPVVQHVAEPTPTPNIAGTAHGRSTPGVNLSKFEDCEDDDWSFVCSRKPSGKKSVLFIGNLKAGIDADSLCKFVQRRTEKAGQSVTVYGTQVFEKESSLPSTRLVVSS